MPPKPKARKHYTVKKQVLVPVSKLYQPVTMKEAPIGLEFEEDQLDVAAQVPKQTNIKPATVVNTAVKSGLSVSTIVAIVVGVIIFGGALIGIAVYFSLYAATGSSSNAAAVVVQKFSSSSSSSSTGRTISSSSSSSSSTSRLASSLGSSSPGSSSSSTGLPRSSSLSSSTNAITSTGISSSISSSITPDFSSSSSSSTGNIVASSSTTASISSSSSTAIISSSLSSSSSSSSATFCDYGPYCNGTYPTTQLGSKLVPSDHTGTQSFFGNAVAITPDATTLVIGGSTDNNVGATWVFMRSSSGATWSQQGNKLIGTGGVSTKQGFKVAVSYDGNTLVTSASSTTDANRAVWIFTRNDTIWTQQGNKITKPGDAIGSAGFGICVSLSSDGNTLAIGGPSDNSGAGATWIYTRSANVWSEQAKLVGTGNTGAASQGESCSLSADGNTLAVGGVTDNSNIGAIWIFVRSGTSWTQQGTKLVGTGYVFSPVYQGYSISISSDGNTVAAGAYNDNSGVGAAWIFVRDGSNSWSQQGSKLVATDVGIGPSNQGISISLSASGNVVAVGGERDSGYVGATWIFTRTGTTWSQAENKLIGTGTQGSSDVEQGHSVSLSNHTMLAVGGLGDNNSIGATWIFY